LQEAQKIKKLLIINQEQFGHHSDTYYYCKYLKDDFNIVYIGWDHGLPAIEMNGVQVVYVSRKGNIFVRTMRFLRHALAQINDKRAIVFIKYFKGVSQALRLLRPKHCFVLDIRTGSVHKNMLARRFHDALLKFETLFFRHVTVISQSLAEKLGIAHKAHILPLGADVISSTHKTFDSLCLLYVGTLCNRKIDISIRGFKQYYDEFKDQIPISFTIIGSGPDNEEQNLRKLAAKYGLKESVNIAGAIPHPQLKPWFDAANVGIAYVPLADYYDCQPVTKTFEYLLSGMPVIATHTSKHREVIEFGNGVLIGETAEDFYSGLKGIFEKRHLFDSAKIRNKAIGYTWKNIVRKNLNAYLENIKHNNA
jgi:glycosyltransferase involved in cell wall biosynthesis